jgi:hypothetical protein
MQKACFLLIGLFGIAGPVQAALPAPSESIVWRVDIRNKELQNLGTVDAPNAWEALAKAVELFDIRLALRNKTVVTKLDEPKPRSGAACLSAVTRAGDARQYEVNRSRRWRRDCGHGSLAIILHNPRTPPVTTNFPPHSSVALRVAVRIPLRGRDSDRDSCA